MYATSFVKVAFAIQVLSSSVADAMKTMEEMGLEEFAVADATIKFIKVHVGNTNHKSSELTLCLLVKRSS